MTEFERSFTPPEFVRRTSAGQNIKPLQVAIRTLEVGEWLKAEGKSDSPKRAKNRVYQHAHNAHRATGRKFVARMDLEGNHWVGRIPIEEAGAHS